MKLTLNSHSNHCVPRGFLSIASFSALALGVILVFGGTPARGGNILLNTNFGLNSGNRVATDWTYFEDPTVPSYVKDYWIGGPPTGGFFATPLSGTQYWKEWGAGYFDSPTNNVAGIYEEFGSSAGSVYQASGWIYSSSSDSLGADNTAWIDVSFLDANNNLLSLYTSGPFSASAGLDTWIQYQVTNACDLSSPVSTGDAYYTNYAVTGMVTSVVAPTGTAKVRYRFNLLQVGKEGGSCYFDDPALNQLVGLEPPIIANVLPQSMIFFPPTNGFNFTASSPSGSTINDSGIQLILNGTNVSGSLDISGSSSNKIVSYSGLQSNTTYNATINVIDEYGLSATESTFFQTTWVGIPPILYLWEAEDFDFNSGMFIDNPDLCNAPGDTNCYFGTIGTPEVDEQSFGVQPPDPNPYRANDQMAFGPSGDYLRENLFQADRIDYAINPFIINQWVNYTRDFTNGTYWMIARLATGPSLSGYLTLSEVSDGATNPVGTFTISDGQGWTTFENIFLLDTNGNKVNLTLNGKTTLQVTSGGNLLPNFFALVSATVDLPIMSGLYPDGAHPFEDTNALAFTVTSDGATFPHSGINVILDGFNVSSSLVFSGSPSNTTVVYPYLLPNATHSVIISVTNSLDHGIYLNYDFDTFSTNNYMVQASDFDFSGGQYIPDADWYPNAYGFPNQYDSETNVDFEHTILGCEQYPYRPNGISQQQGYDYLTPIFVSSGGIDYDLGCFGAGDWANYTRTYPPGAYFVYIRAAGLGSNSMNLEQVVSGVGTSSQVVQNLGYLNNPNGINDVTHTWIPLTDDGSVAPIVVTLTGLETLRLTTTTGDCYPNYFMFVPASGIKMSASKQGANALLSFTTQTGVVYRVFSRQDLSSGYWSLMTNVLGNGAVETVGISPGASAQFYRVTAP